MEMDAETPSLPSSPSLFWAWLPYLTALAIIIPPLSTWYIGKIIGPPICRLLVKRLAKLLKDSLGLELDVERVDGAFFFSRTAVLHGVQLRNSSSQVKAQSIALSLSWRRLRKWPQLPLTEIVCSHVSGFITVPNGSRAEGNSGEWKVYSPQSMSTFLGFDLNLSLESLKITNIDLEMRYAGGETAKIVFLYALSKPYRTSPNPLWDLMNCEAMGTINDQEFTLKHLLGRQVGSSDKFRVKKMEELVGKWVVKGVPLRFVRDLGFPVKELYMIHSGYMALEFVTTRDLKSPDVWTRNVSINFKNLKVHIPPHISSIERVFVESFARSINQKKSFSLSFSYSTPPEGNAMPQAAKDFDDHLKNALMSSVNY